MIDSSLHKGVIEYLLYLSTTATTATPCLLTVTHTTVVECGYLISFIYYEWPYIYLWPTLTLCKVQTIHSWQKLPQYFPVPHLIYLLSTHPNSSLLPTYLLLLLATTYLVGFPGFFVSYLQLLFRFVKGS